ncbi:MAG: hypothetical protein ACJA2M_002380 [Polaribacter sp.]|jgi:hypothetical protein
MSLKKIGLYRGNLILYKGIIGAPLYRPISVNPLYQMDTEDYLIAFGLFWPKSTKKRGQKHEYFFI